MQTLHEKVKFVVPRGNAWRMKIVDFAPSFVHFRILHSFRPDRRFNRFKDFIFSYKLLNVLDFFEYEPLEQIRK